jgi:hypothetical protein
METTKPLNLSMYLTMQVLQEITMQQMKFENEAELNDLWDFYRK